MDTEQERAPLEASAADETPPFTAGFFPGEDFNTYATRQLGVVNNSGLKIFRDRSPAHYKAWAEGEYERPDTAKLKLGRIVHVAILEPERFKNQYLLMPDFGAMQSSINRAKRDAWLKERREEEPEAIIVTEEQLTKALAMREAVLRHKTARLLIERGNAEETMRWFDERTGLRCKARLDWRVPEMQFAMDLKSTDNASPKAFMRSIINFGYHIQHCHYADGTRVLGAPIRNYLICAVESEAPYAVAVYHIDAALEERGFQILHRDMDRMLECVNRNEWPAYSDNIEQLSAPGWAFYD